MRVIKVLIGIRDYRLCNPPAFSPMKIGGLKVLSLVFDP